MVNALFMSGVPDILNVAEMVTIPKKGDASDIDNNRGISLIPIVVKITMTVVIDRVMAAMERHGGGLSETQAGFVSFEESVNHAIALYEIIARRTAVHKPTFLAFLDLRKAYDTVPHEALMRKLELRGVHGRCLTFLRALYDNSMVRVRLHDGSLSQPIPVLRGVRQGCTGSPSLFNVFINDLPARLAAGGRGVPAGSDDKGTRLASGDNISNLFFADDGVLIAGSVNELCDLLGTCNVWGDENEMAFAHPKCGAMAFGEGAQDELRDRAVDLLIGGRAIPVVDEYSSLGLLFRTSDTVPDLALMARTLAEKGRKALFKYRNLLCQRQLPMATRVLILRQCVCPVLTYGGALWGMGIHRAEPGQRVVNRGLRWIFGMSGVSTATASITMGEELGVPPVYSIVAAERARVYAKASESRTVLGRLLGHNADGCMSRSWASATKRSLSTLHRKFGVTLQNDNGQLIHFNTLLNRRLASKLRMWVFNSSWETRRATSSVISFEVYRTTVMGDARKYLALRRLPIGMHPCLHWLARLRVGAFYTQTRIRHELLPEMVHGRCAFCGVEGEETVTHLLVECARWHQVRQTFLHSLITYITNNWIQGLPGEVAAVHNRLIAYFLLGGRRILTEVPDAEPVPLVDGGLEWTKAWLGRQPPEPAGPGAGAAAVVQGGGGAVAAHPLGVVLEDGVPSALLTHMPFLRVARFLSTVIPLRQQIIAHLRAEEY
jgi:hypothetical protein